MRVKGTRVLKNGALAGYVYYSDEKKWKWRIIGRAKTRSKGGAKTRSKTKSRQKGGNQSLKNHFDSMAYHFKNMKKPQVGTWLRARKKTLGLYKIIKTTEPMNLTKDQISEIKSIANSIVEHSKKARTSKSKINKLKYCWTALNKNFDPESSTDPQISNNLKCIIYYHAIHIVNPTVGDIQINMSSNPLFIETEKKAEKNKKTVLRRIEKIYKNKNMTQGNINKLIKNYGKLPVKQMKEIEKAEIEKAEIEKAQAQANAQRREEEKAEYLDEMKNMHSFLGQNYNNEQMSRLYGKHTVNGIKEPYIKLQQQVKNKKRNNERNEKTQLLSNINHMLRNSGVKNITIKKEIKRTKDLNINALRKYTKNLANNYNQRQAKLAKNYNKRQAKKNMLTDIETHYKKTMNQIQVQEEMQILRNDSTYNEIVNAFMKIHS